LRAFYRLDDERLSKPENSGMSEDKESLGKISLSLGKKHNKRIHGGTSDEQSSSSSVDMDTDDESMDYPLLRKVSRRQYAHVNGSDKRLYHRRPSGLTNQDFGCSEFDYDTQVMNIGLPSLQNLDCQEIAIPSFRKIPSQCIDRKSTKDCVHCTVDDPWSDILKLHSQLEAQERLRFKNINNSRIRL